MSRTRRHWFEPATLSRDGVERRARVLGELHEAMDRRVARKRAVRTAAGVALVVAFAAGVVSVVWASRPGALPAFVPAPTPVATSDAPSPRPAPAPATAASKRTIAPVASITTIVTRPARAVALVTTDADIVRRMTVPTRASSVEIISDSALQTELASAGVDPGLVTIDGRTLVTLAAGKDQAQSRQ